MGCWGITAFESDAGLDAVAFIRKNLPKDGKLELENMIKVLQQDEWNAPPDVTDAESHTSPMVLAEILVKFLDQDIGSLDDNGEWAAEDNKFAAITSFAASKESILWVRDYVFDTLRHAKEHSEFSEKYGEKWNGWFEEKNWVGWQEHMEALVSRLDILVVSTESHMELIPQQEQGREQDKSGSNGELTEKIGWGSFGI